ncbi:SusD/RagB family nutrient-binding outer membrane lipoprotein [Moheibacter lacus]|uniref:SusD/RagB family nutrient-binding outer membrane lipoprotein n=1 Tax=Moheibacter lacus TaxID=2745851 RepID=A0A838ZK39_9FLAO|nr:SusD/RagB family nutrient-binding outer membrane lipoprotein [Moheibacter lacus]MBA5629608.1 SusD/RagB family nutrient-binding outer membrane lipoprotein [Moheibacter lacus]
MKKYIIAIGIATGIMSCSDDYYDSLNVDQDNPSDVPASFLVTSATTSLFDQMTSTNVNTNVFRFFSQYFTTTTYLDEPNYDLNTRNINGNHWNELYTDVLYDLKDAKIKVQNDANITEAQRNNQLAVIETLEVYAWQILVDTFGNVPYTEALQGLDNTFPVYDDAATIYSDLITRISTAINMFNTSEGGFGSDDIIYGDNMSAWKKAAASLKLRLGMQLSDVNPSLAQTTISQAISSGVFTSNADSFIINYLSATPYSNPVYDDLVLSGRQDFLAANTIVDYMNELSDPRRPMYFDQNLGDNVYSGGIYGTSNSYDTYTHLGEKLHTATTPGVLIDYAEIEFLMAEALAKGLSVPGTIESHYNAGIMASMEYWEVSEADITTYMGRADVAYSSAPGTAKQKVAKQFWLAMFNRGFEGWNVWRRLDAPTLNVAAQSGDPVPTRYTYPLSEASLNVENYNAAASAIGGDDLNTKLFWDVN